MSEEKPQPKMSQAEFLQRLGDGFNEVIPHNVDIGVKTESISKGDVVVHLPFREHWLADPQHGLIHTGLVISIADSASGLAVFSTIGGGERIATLDLRLDYLRAALAPHDLFCRAHVVRETSRIVFVTAHVFQRIDGEELRVAIGQGSFMRTGRRKGGWEKKGTEKTRWKKKPGAAQ